MAGTDALFHARGFGRPRRSVRIARQSIGQTEQGPQHLIVSPGRRERRGGRDEGGKIARPGLDQQQSRDIGDVVGFDGDKLGVGRDDPGIDRRLGRFAAQEASLETGRLLPVRPGGRQERVERGLALSPKALSQQRAETQRRLRHRFGHCAQRLEGACAVVGEPGRQHLRRSCAVRIPSGQDP